MRFDQVCFRYARRADWTLRGVTATVEPGQAVVVLGRNGAGKSTFLQLAAGVLQPVRGVVRDRPAVVGWVPERFPADQPFTAEQYLRRTAQVRGTTDADAVDRWMRRLLLTDHAGTRLSELSKGTAQKVGLAQALLVPPGLLVLDEPWEGLDSVARTLLPEIIAEVTGAGGSVLISDHRGEMAAVAGALHWTVADGTVHPGAPSPADPVASPPPGSGEQRPMAGPPSASQERGRDDEVEVHLAVRRAEADQLVVQLRAAGHRVLGVRETADQPARPGGGEVA